MPLVDLGDGTYQTQVGGLYPGGENEMPASHLALGLERAAQIQPTNGKIGMISIGVSNTMVEFDAFIDKYQGNPDLSPNVVLVNGAQSGRAVGQWTSPDAVSWQTLYDRLAELGVSRDQVQAAWVKLPEKNPDELFPLDAETYSEQLAAVMRSLTTNFPSVQVAFLSSRTYGGYSTGALNPEPFAYQHGFGVKWTIEDQLNGQGDLNANPDDGPVVAPWIGWGAYLWANGLGSDGRVGGVPGRSDGLEWLCSDFGDDGTHPSEAGAEKVADLLWDHLTSDPVACSWFLAPDAECQVAPPPPPGPSFVDISGSVFADDIEWLASSGITTGCNPPANDRFCPEDSVTRGQMAAFLNRALGLPAGNEAFTDDDESVFEADIEALASAGITTGCNPPANDQFCPEDNVTRGEMAAFLNRAFGLRAGTEAFSDDDESVFEADIEALASAGITTGCNPPANDRFCPGENVTRGQMAAFLHRSELFFS